MENIFIKIKIMIFSRALHHSGGFIQYIFLTIPKKVKKIKWRSQAGVQVPPVCFAKGTAGPKGPCPGVSEAKQPHGFIQVSSFHLQYQLSMYGLPVVSILPGKCISKLIRHHKGLRIQPRNQHTL